MSDYSLEEQEISERSDSGCESNNSPRFGEEQKQNKDNNPTQMLDLKTTEINNDAFEIAQDVSEEPIAVQNDKGVKTLYRPGLTHLLNRNSSNDEPNFDRNNSSDSNHLKRPSSSPAVNLNKKTGASPSQGENEEVRYQLPIIYSLNLCFPTQILSLPPKTQGTKISNFLKTKHYQKIAMINTIQ